ncbi:MAG: sulfatase-like hydrolase/transferase, partial [Alistipes sp.]|nr:sulfatase-like hydrolase/transferase [Alistipes sp.]
FIDKLKASGLYDRSIIVIVSDHDAYTQNLYDGRKKCEPEDRFIPLLILNSPIKTDTDRVIAQADIYPSLLDIMGVENYCFHGLGESVFRGRSDYACSYLGEVGDGGRNAEVRQWRNDMWRLSDILIRTDYFATH